MKENKLLQVLCLAIVLFFTLGLATLSPYKYSWDEELKQLSDGAVFFFNAMGVLTALFIIFGLLLAKGSRKWVFILYAVITLLILIKLIWINTLTS